MSAWITWAFGSRPIFAYAVSTGGAQDLNLAWGGQKIPGWVLGIDPALNRPAPLLNVLLLKGEALARSDLDLRLDEIDAGHELGDRVLDLDAGVHLQEVEVLVSVHQKLDGAGADVVHCLRSLDRDLAHLFANSIVDRC